MAEAMMQAIEFGGSPFVLHGRRALLWPAERAMIVSDLHLGKGHSYAKDGQLLPPYDALETLTQLQQLLQHFKPARVIALGDSFHRAESLSELSKKERSALERCLESVPHWHWILGNHDPEPPRSVAGEVATQWSARGIIFQHDAPDKEALKDAPHVIGHYHPKITLELYRRPFTYPCFAWSERLMVMPAFGSFTGGLSIRHRDMKKLLARSPRFVCTGREGELICDDQAASSSRSSTN